MCCWIARCPLAPQLYRQAKVCEAEQVPFHSKIELMETLIREFEPVAGTQTHILLDSWYCAKCLWHAARERDFLITTGSRAIAGCALLMKRLPKAGAGKSSRTMPLS